MQVGEFLESVSAEIKASDVPARVKVILVEREVSARADAVLAVLGKLDEVRKAARKIKPDQVSYDAQGKIVSESYSKAKADELKKNGEEAAKVEAAIAKAFEGDFGKVKELGGKGNDNG